MGLRRPLAVTLMSLLALSLLWGGCAPCQQIFLSASQQGGCCLPTGKCKTPAPVAPAHKICTTPALVLEQYISAPMAHVAQADAAAVRVLTPKWAFIPTFERHSAVLDVLPFDSPPELFQRHSALLI